ncbi:family 20 glycosylhydrolase, partial [Streptomyces sp. DSM 41634]
TFPEGVVNDRPDRPQRGLNLDIARKHYSAEWIEDRVREMADLKLNQLGLHFSDDQAFRIESKTHPEVVSDEALTQDEVRRIVGLANSLHIEVVPEIDSPGHLGAVLRAHPDLQLRNTQGRESRGSIDISKPGAAKLIDELLDEYTELFPGKYWHLGA